MRFVSNPLTGCLLIEYLAAQEPQRGEGGINKFCLQAANYHRHRHAKYLKAKVDQSQTLGAFTPVMDNKPADISPEDKALIERQIASALCYLCGGVVSEPLPDKMMVLLEDIVTREARRQRNLSMAHEDNEKDHAL